MIHYFRNALLGEVLLLHSLRHTFGTLQAQSGLPALILKEVLGHSQMSTTERYVDAAQSLAPILQIPMILNPHTQEVGCEKETESVGEVA
jgi:integrase